MTDCSIWAVIIYYNNRSLICYYNDYNHRILVDCSFNAMIHFGNWDIINFSTKILINCGDKALSDVGKKLIINCAIKAMFDFGKNYHW